MELLGRALAGEFRGVQVALHLFSGPADRGDGIAAMFEQAGWRCIDIDTVNGAADDLLNDALWEAIFAGVTTGVFQFVWMGPPCSTFSPARQHGAGPKPVRDAQHHRGFPKEWLKPPEIEEVRAANYYVIQCCRLGALALQAGCAWAIENPMPWTDRGCTSMFDFEEFIELMGRPGVKVVEFHQCMFGAETAKPTRVVHCGVDLASLEAWCNHPPKKWWCEYRDNWGKEVKEWQWAPHKKLVRSRDAKGVWASKAAAAYPGPMNAAVVAAVVASREAALAVPQGSGRRE